MYKPRKRWKYRFECFLKKKEACTIFFSFSLLCKAQRRRESTGCRTRLWCVTPPYVTSEEKTISLTLHPYAEEKQREKRPSHEKDFNLSPIACPFQRTSRRHHCTNQKKKRKKKHSTHTLWGSTAGSHLKWAHVDSTIRASSLESSKKKKSDLNSVNNWEKVNYVN